jgi:hypothetical protein
MKYLAAGGHQNSANLNRSLGTCHGEDRYRAHVQTLSREENAHTIVGRHHSVGRIKIQREVALPDAAFPIELTSPPAAGIGRFKRPFYLFVALLIAIAVAYGFSQTISQNLIFPSVPDLGFSTYTRPYTSLGWSCLSRKQFSFRRRTYVSIVGLGGLASSWVARSQEWELEPHWQWESSI